MHQPTAHVPLPEITVDANGTARSLVFDDVYFSARGGVAECEHVFLGGNGLPARWQEKSRFTIGELGFGTGLNFLVAAEAFLRSNAHGTLHFISVEHYPLTPAQLREMHGTLLGGVLTTPTPAAQATPAASRLAPLDGATRPPYTPQLLKLAEVLCAAYPLRLPGWHRVNLGRVQLTLGFGDAAALLPQMRAQVDAWFLDGFAPAKNAAMWSDAVLQHVARLSAPGATLATFTAAGAVKRGLEQVGFTMQKTRGFAHKRDMLVGEFVNEGGQAFGGSGRSHVLCDASAPLHGLMAGSDSCPRAVLLQRPEDTGEAEAGVSPPSKVIVIGAGIAGATAAHALAERGVEVTVLEAQQVASGASGNPVAALYPQLTKYYTGATAWHAQAYSFTLQQLARWQAQGIRFGWAQPGMLRLAKDDAEAARLRSMQQSLQLDTSIAQWMEADAASALLGHAVAQPGYYFPQGSWVRPAELCAALLAHPRITLRTQQRVQQLLPQADGRWAAQLGDGHTMIADAVVVANANDAATLLPQAGLQIRPSAGQVSVLSAAALQPVLPVILCQKGYAIHTAEQLLIGATYDHADFSGAVTDANHTTNLAELQHALAHATVDAALLQGGRTALRATTPQRLPYVGAVATGLYVSAGHGSRGMISAPLAAEIIASDVMGEPLPLSHALCAALRRLAH